MQQIYLEEHPCRSGISIKLLCNFIKITLWYGCSPVNLLHIFRTPFLKNTSGRLLLQIASSCDIPCRIVTDVLQKQPQAVFYKKRCSQTLTQVFSCEFCEHSKNTFFIEHLSETASGVISQSQDYLVEWVFYLRKQFLKCAGSFLA